MSHRLGPSPGHVEQSEEDLRACELTSWRSLEDLVRVLALTLSREHRGHLD